MRHVFEIGDRVRLVEEPETRGKVVGFEGHGMYRVEFPPVGSQCFFYGSDLEPVPKRKRGAR